MQIHPSLSLIRPCLPSVAAAEVRRAHVRQWGDHHKEIPTCSAWHVLHVVHRNKTQHQETMVVVSTLQNF